VRKKVVVGNSKHGALRRNRKSKGRRSSGIEGGNNLGKMKFWNNKKLGG